MRRSTRLARLNVLVLILGVLASLTVGFTTETTTTIDTAAWASKVDANVLEAATAGSTEMMVLLARQADLSGASRRTTKAEKGQFVYDQLTSVAARTQTGILDQLTLLGVPHRSFWIVNAVWTVGDASLVQQLASRPDVAMVLPSPVGGLETPLGPDGTDDTDVVQSAEDPTPYGIDMVQAPRVWNELGIDGAGAVVASADVGVEWTHQALQANYRGWDPATGTATHDYNWHNAVPDPRSGCVGAAPCDDQSHGTHTVGTMVGHTPTEQIGVAPGAEWIGCRNMGTPVGVGAVPTYLECMEWLLAPTDSNGENPRPDLAPDVVNNSWGCLEACAPPLLHLQLQASRAAGIAYVASAGNEGDVGCSSIEFPLAVYEEAITVGATTAGDGIAGFSSRGPVLSDGSMRMKPDVSAPGNSVRSAVLNNGYGNKSGTSMAAPHVAGVIALIVSARPDLAGDVDTIQFILEHSGVRKTTGEGCGGDTADAVPNNVYGHGRLDAFAAVQLALALDNRAPVAVADEAMTTEGTTVDIDVLANDVDPDGDPLTVTGASAPANGTATVAADGQSVTYAPNDGFAGTDQFVYTVEDGRGGVATAAVTVTVQEACVPPTIDDSDAAVAYDGGWGLEESPDASAGTYHRRSGPDVYRGKKAHVATVSFSGDAVSYAFATLQDGGRVDLAIDGAWVDTLDFSGPTSEPAFGASVTYTGLGDGEHELTITYVGGTVIVDGFTFACGGDPG